jgi:hypothetical protein
MDSNQSVDMVVRLPESGTYTVVVGGFVSAGRYKLSVQ